MNLKEKIEIIKKEFTPESCDRATWAANEELKQALDDYNMEEAHNLCEEIDYIQYTKVELQKIYN